MRPENQALLRLTIAFLAFCYLSLKTFVLLSISYIAYNVFQIFSNMEDNPFRNDNRRPRDPYVTDQKKRDAILKQSFASSKVNFISKFSYIFKQLS